MSFSNSNGYEFCKECFKQQQFCTCPTSCSSDSLHHDNAEPCDQTFTEHNPSCQSIGEQEQQQQQQQGGLEQSQGPQTQDQVQEGQRQGPQIQKQGPQTQGDQTQGPQTQDQIELQEQTQGSQSQDQTEDQDQTQGPQLQAQRHGDQTMENNQTISTPVDVDGVTVNVKCGDCQPIIFPDFDFFKKHKDRKHCDGGCDDMESCDCKECKDDKCPKDCNCCVQNLAELLNGVRQVQATASNPVDIYFSVLTGLANPTEDQVITNVVDCSVLKFKPVGQTTVVPNTTVQLCDVAGICAAESNAPDVFQFLLEQSTNDQVNTDDCTCKRKKKPCSCPCCARGIGEELRCTANFGLLLNVFIQGLTTPLNLYVLNVKDCLVYFGINSATAPTGICVFSLCAVTGFTVVPQMLG